MPPRLHHLPAYEYRRERWRNGLGWTREVARRPAEGDGWEWRLSIAEIDRDAAFSAFPGVDRELVLVHGNGVRLRFADGEVVEVLPPHGKVRFAGEREAFGELIDGPTHDFNLMWRRDRWDAALWHRPLVGSMVLFAAAGETWAVHQLAGHAVGVHGGERARLESGDTLLLEAGEERARLALDGSGALLVIRLQPLSTATGVTGAPPAGDRQA